MKTLRILATCSLLIFLPGLVLHAQSDAPMGGAETASDIAKILNPVRGASAPPGLFNPSIVNDQLVSLESSHVDHHGWRLSINLSNNKKFLLIQFPCVELPQDHSLRTKALEAFMRENASLGFMRFETYEGSEMVYLTYPIRNELLSEKLLVDAVNLIYSEASQRQDVWTLASIKEPTDAKADGGEYKTSEKGGTSQSTTADTSPATDYIAAGFERLDQVLQSSMKFATVSGPSGSGLTGVITMSPLDAGQFSWLITTTDGNISSKGTYSINDRILVLKHDHRPEGGQSFKFKSFDVSTGKLILAHPSGLQLEFDLEQKSL